MSLAYENLSAADLNIRKRFETKQQNIHQLQEGVTFGDGKHYNPAEYQRYACQFTQDYKEKHYPEEAVTPFEEGGEESTKKFTCENLERDYWNIVENKTKELVIDYGNDVNTNEFGSGFPLSKRGRSIYSEAEDTPKEESAKGKREEEPEFGTDDYYRETYWNTNNIPWSPESLLKHVKVGINGINVPWMYYGNLFSTFCWHNEDNYLYSVQYLHQGAPKRWYGVPGTDKDSSGLEKVFNAYLASKTKDIPDLLHHITTMISPRLLLKANVPIYKIQQHPGEYVITFPKAFHGGFSFGPNIGEAVNFAPQDWLTCGSQANERYRSFGRPSVFAQNRLLFTMAYHLDEVKSYANCLSLLKELERLTKEELDARKQLIKTGVRDVSNVIKLPKNKLNQLDDASADYDDKRLCYACKHVCFLSCVGCECSQSKVSCLRHSHSMCRCVTRRRYFMIWTPEKELSETLDKVRTHLATLEKPAGAETEDSKVSNAEKPSGHDLPEIAEGVEKDIVNHKDETISLEPFDPKRVRREHEEQSTRYESRSSMPTANTTTTIATKSVSLPSHRPPEIVSTDEE